MKLGVRSLGGEPLLHEFLKEVEGTPSCKSVPVIV